MHCPSSRTPQRQAWHRRTGSIFAEVLDRRLKRIAELETTPVKRTSLRLKRSLQCQGSLIEDIAGSEPSVFVGRCYYLGASHWLRFTCQWLERRPPIHSPSGPPLAFTMGRWFDNLRLAILGLATSIQQRILLVVGVEAPFSLAQQVPPLAPRYRSCWFGLGVA